MISLVNSKTQGRERRFLRIRHAREADIIPRQTAIDLMNRSLLADLALVNGGRTQGSPPSAFRSASPFAMRRGLVPPGRLPLPMQSNTAAT